MPFAQDCSLLLQTGGRESLPGTRYTLVLGGQDCDGVNLPSAIAVVIWTFITYTHTTSTEADRIGFFAVLRSEENCGSRLLLRPDEGRRAKIATFVARI